MLDFQKNFSLRNFNTFGINVYAHYFVNVKSIGEIQKTFCRYPYIKKFFLGNGSNILFLKNYYQGLVIKIGIKGKKVIKETNSQAIVQAFAGENWNKFVGWTIKKGFIGLENLSFIPGTVGASPIQNIGAYGVEVKDTLLEVKVYETDNGIIKSFTREECKLEYRNSFFKHPHYRNKFIVLSVTFLLGKKNKKLNTSYIEIRKELENMNIKQPTPYDLRKAIFNIRKRKLPKKKIGNAGSFFMNPIVGILYLKRLQYKHPTITYWKNKNKVKLSASSLIETIGWKGKKIGDVGVYEKNPIVLVNYGKASGMDVYSFSKKINKELKKKLGIVLPIEVNIIKY
ncbi:MAG: UDP-N-acetylmuramate dehydrogenase [Flavobacteriales bacterium]|jgi:UDP-N-acetylmuramate dehydrogenase|uniref:UDP-N-acetylmuramate dehydrogenase n=1 Tax=Blattabacterium sp. (Mastotermes darwiniensis) TaxID=39768 RepID=UPI000231DF91|nr:UDP-N-acetylmuramate dehydrogenase [Blattabacterium sp. (Mastotermes darwiniensis)]AER40425.1 UDP-N-acetylenolpyruvoylglucosamine reductase [Blattabacterium sp. (Mastotermes darwiniensis) str. MADAR]MDR1804853.1 UDP-N-acetylmuramate dehydrogenase [Flavobacteriales bacterium]